MKKAIIIIAPVAAGLALAPVAQADAVLIVPGAWVDYGVPTPFIDEWNTDPVKLKIGDQFYNLPGVTPVIVDYHRNPIFAVDGNIDDGATKTMAQIDAELAKDPNSKIVVTSLSQGTLVAEEVKHRLANDPKYAGANVEFVQVGTPKHLADRLFPMNTFVPLVNYTTRPTEVTEYNSTWVNGEYDGWADPPKDLNPLAWANSLAGTAYVHSQSGLADINDATLVSEKTNEKGGVDKVYLVHTKNLPLTQPIRDTEKFLTGKTDATDGLDRVLRPAIDASYDRDGNGLSDGLDKHNAAVKRFADGNKKGLETTKKQLKQARKDVRKDIKSAVKKLKNAIKKGPKGDDA